LPPTSPPTYLPVTYQVFDTFVANISLFLVGLVECVAVGWVYGVEQFSADANAMCGRPLPKPLLWSLQVSKSVRRKAGTHHVKLTYLLTYLLTHFPTFLLAYLPTYWHAQYLIPLLLAGLLCTSAMSSIHGEYNLPPGGVACGWALALVCCAPTPIVAWRAIKPCSWLWHRLRRRGAGAPPRIGDAAAGSPRRSNTRAGAASELYAVRAAVPPATYIWGG